jgi:hypothetical protein
MHKMYLDNICPQALPSIFPITPPPAYAPPARHLHAPSFLLEPTESS